MSAPRFVPSPAGSNSDDAEDDQPLFPGYEHPPEGPDYVEVPVGISYYKPTAPRCYRGMDFLGNFVGSQTTPNPRRFARASGSAAASQQVTVPCATACTATAHLTRTLAEEETGNYSSGSSNRSARKRSRSESGVNEWNKVRSTDDDLLGEISVNSEEDDSE